MGFSEGVAKQVALLKEGKILEALDRLFAKEGIMYSNSVLFGTGYLNCRRMQEPFLAAAKNIRADISEVILHKDKELCLFRNRTKFDGPDGVERHIDGLHIQKWQDGKIICEWYYNGEPMQLLLTKGVMQNPEIGCVPPLG